MNPGWLIAGLLIGERISPAVRRHGKTVVRTTYWKAEGALARFGTRHAYRRWLSTLPTKELS